MKNLLFLLISFLIINQTKAQNKSQDSLLNLSAPKIEFVSEFSSQLKPDFYKGKVLVLDFWATWCAPCIASFPHMNQLTDEFNNKGVAFAAISNESQSIVNAFFNRTKKELKMISLLDDKNKTFSNFFVNTIPCCVVIDKNNIIRWIGNSSNLTADILNNILEGKQGNFHQEDKIKTKELKEEKEGVPLFNFSLSLVDPSLPVSVFSRNDSDLGVIEMVSKNRTFAEALEDLTGINKSVSFISNDSTKLTQHIKFSYNTRQIKSNYFANEFSGKFIAGLPRTNFLIYLLQQAMNCTITKTKKEMSVYELKVTDSTKLASFRSLQDSHNSSTGNDYFPKLEIVGYNLKAIGNEIESGINKVVVCDLKENVRYDISLDFTSKKTLDETLAFHGLQLIKKDAQAEFLNINFK